MKKKKKNKEMTEKDVMKDETTQQAGGADPAETGSHQELSLEEQLESQKQKNQELNDKFLRLYAEFDNFRRRTNRERIELIQTSSAELILALLPVLDDFDRAIQAFEQSGDAESIKEGILLVNNKFKSVLGQKGLKEMQSVGEPFNEEFHDAVANAPAATEEGKGKIMDEVEKGYYLNDKILRHAKVVVAT